MTSISGSAAPSLDFQAMRTQFQQGLFSRMSGGGDSISLQNWQQALQKLPGAGGSAAAILAAGSGSTATAGVTGTGTASAVDAAFKSMDSNGDGQLTQSEFSTALDGMLDQARQRHRQGGAGTPLDAQLLGQQQASGGVAAPDTLRRMLLGYGANAA